MDDGILAPGVDEEESFSSVNPSEVHSAEEEEEATLSSGVSQSYLRASTSRRNYRGSLCLLEATFAGALDPCHGVGGDTAGIVGALARVPLRRLLRPRSHHHRRGFLPLGEKSEKRGTSTQHATAKRAAWLERMSSRNMPEYGRGAQEGEKQKAPQRRSFRPQRRRAQVGLQVFPREGGGGIRHGRQAEARKGEGRDGVGSVAHASVSGPPGRHFPPAGGRR